MELQSLVWVLELHAVVEKVRASSRNLEIGIVLNAAICSLHAMTAVVCVEQTSPKVQATSMEQTGESAHAVETGEICEEACSQENDSLARSDLSHCREVNSRI